MEYAIFPMKTISISQGYSSSHKAFDCNGSSGDRTTKDYWYAPCTLKVLKLLDKEQSGYYNTILFGTCDEKGNQASVMCEDGIARVLTFACTHMDTVDWDTFNHKENDIIPSGAACYREGFTGLNETNPSHGNHVHMEVGLGWQYKKQSDHYLKDTLLSDGRTVIGNTFYQLKGFNSVGFQGTQGYTFKEVSSRKVEDSGSTTPTTPPSTNTNLKLVATKQAFRIRSSVVSGSIITTIAVGGSVPITEFLGIQSDGYQWVKVNHNGTSGYSQLDTYNCYTISGVPTTTLKLSATKQAFRIRSSVVSGSIITTIAVGGSVPITEFLGIQSDGYQWVKVNHNGTSGYSQLDTYNCYTIKK